MTVAGLGVDAGAANAIGEPGRVPHDPDGPALDPSPAVRGRPA